MCAEYRSTSRGMAKIDVHQLEHNIQAYRSLLKPKTKLMAVVKANAYGHGLVKTAQVAQMSGVDALGVATVEEGVILRKNGMQMPILVFGRSSECEINAILEYNLTQTVCDEAFLKKLNYAAHHRQQKALIHVKFNTGMNRIGLFGLSQWQSFLNCLKECDWVTLDGIFTHFSDADGTSNAYTYAQMERFEAFIALLEQNGYRKEKITIHACNSAATKAFPEYHYDMVRVGIGLYGYPQVPFEEVKSVLSWSTYITHIQTLPAGAQIGYGRSATLPKEAKIATISIGYGDGYHRLLSNRAEVIIQGKRRKIIGRICMDQSMVLLEDEDDFQVGEEVLLVSQELNAQEVAQWAETISYEVLLSISPRIPRIYVE